MEYPDIKGIDSSFCTHKILMEDEFKPSVQSQRRVNPNIKEVVKKEVIKLIDARLIYPISDSSWVSYVQVVPKKGGMTVVKNEKDELIPQRTVTGWIKPHSPAPIGLSHTDECLSDYAMPPSTFQRCLTAIFHELIEDSIELFMDDFSVFDSSFDHFLKNLEKMLKRCEETNLVLNWEKCHFMVKEGIIRGHNVSGSGIEVDKAKIEAISKLPYPTNVKVIRSFLGHVGFYRRFIKDFSQIARLMTQLLVKDAPFNFSRECIQAFDTLKRKVMQVPIMIKQDWSLPFEIMCDASDYAVGEVLGQRIDKHFKPIHYASKTINKAQENYTTTEKEILAVVFTFDKFCQYLVLSKTIIHDKKGTENLVADHLSRLENPDLGKLTKAEIRDLFPEERLMAIFDKNNELWMNPSYSNNVLTKSYKGAWREMRQHKFFNNVIMDHLEDIMTLPQPQEKSSRPGPFPSSNRNKYVLVAIDYVSKWVDAQAFPTNDARNVWSGSPILNRVSPSDERAGQKHEPTIKHILEKTIKNNRKDWSYKLDYALWAFRTAFKTSLGTTPFRIIYDKACHLLVELEHMAYWAIKNYNLDLTKVRENRFLQINELDKMRLDAYKNSISYKE
ncbi:reverse transcriptase domain-containing protein [Tanacetum coccineum]